MDKQTEMFQLMSLIIELTLVVFINWISNGNTRGKSLILYPNQLSIYKSMFFLLPICDILCSSGKENKCLMSCHIEEEIWCVVSFFVPGVSTNKHKRQLIIDSQQLPTKR